MELLFSQDKNPFIISNFAHPLFDDDEVRRLNELTSPVEVVATTTAAAATAHHQQQPLVPIYTFTARDDRKLFPVENRFLVGHMQDLHALSSYISNWAPNEFLEVKSQLYKLIYVKLIFPFTYIGCV